MISWRCFLWLMIKTWQMGTALEKASQQVKNTPVQIKPKTIWGILTCQWEMCHLHTEQNQFLQSSWRKALRHLKPSDSLAWLSLSGRIWATQSFKAVSLKAYSAGSCVTYWRKNNTVNVFWKQKTTKRSFEIKLQPQKIVTGYSATSFPADRGPGLLWWHPRSLSARQGISLKQVSHSTFNYTHSWESFRS